MANLLKDGKCAGIGMGRFEQASAAFRGCLGAAQELYNEGPWVLPREGAVRRVFVRAQSQKDVMLATPHSGQLTHHQSR